MYGGCVLESPGPTLNDLQRDFDIDASWAKKLSKTENAILIHAKKADIYTEIQLIYEYIYCMINMFNIKIITKYSLELSKENMQTYLCSKLTNHKQLVHP